MSVISVLSKWIKRISYKDISSGSANQMLLGTHTHI